MYVLDSSGDVELSDSWCGKLARVDVGDFPHCSVHVLQIFSLHDQDGLSWVKVELWAEKHRQQRNRGAAFEEHNVGRHKA